MNHDVQHYDGRGFCICGCFDCRAHDGRCRCHDCPCGQIDRCQGARGCMLCRPVWTVAA